MRQPMCWNTCIELNGDDVTEKLLGPSTHYPGVKGSTMVGGFIDDQWV